MYLLRILMLSLILVSGSDGVFAAQPDSSQQKLKAFARTFGYVRYFHPSDQASLVDWEAMAYFGAKETLASSEDESIQQLLTRLFDPIVVDLDIYQGTERDRPETKEVGAEKIVAWQHVGIGLGQGGGLYRSGRLNRSAKVDKPTAGLFGNLMSGIDPTELRGQKIRYRFDAKVDEGKCRLQGWWRVDRESGKRGLFENMNDRPIRGRQWKEYELVGKVDDDAKALTFGVIFFGSGSALVDNVRLEQQDGDDWVAIELPNADFEKGDKSPDGWVNPVSGYLLKIENEDVSNGKQAVRILRGSSEAGGQRLFDAVPEMGEVVDFEITPDLRLRFPLALPADTKHSTGDDDSTEEFVRKIAETEVDFADQPIASVANVVLLWNVFQHFYPYFDQVETDWDRALETALENAAKADKRKAATKNLQWLIAQLHDGHGRCIDVQSRRSKRLAPVNFSWVEEQLVVAASDIDDYKVGDVVVTVNDKPAIEHLQASEELISGSPQWKRYRSTTMLTRGTDPLAMVIDREGEKIESNLIYERRQPFQVDRGDVVRIEVEGEDDSEHIWYIDMGRAEPKDLRPKLKEFAEARGIVLDFRGYPRGTQFMFQHMTDEHMQSQKWLVPHQYRPDRTDMKFPPLGRWEMPPLKPRFKGKMVFITNGSAISYAESCMSIVANYKLGDIIGGPTAGANGNVNPFSLPGGYRVYWTGMRVINHDDTQHHVRGVQPTIPMKPTIAGIKAGTDELLEKATELIAGK